MSALHAAVPDWSLSVVSHGHLQSIGRLLGDCRRLLDPQRFEILLTLNRPEAVPPDLAWGGALHVLRNERPQGFASNHNAALGRARGRWVAALDPDLRLHSDPFAQLAPALADAELGIVAPCVVHPDGRIADHARRVPGPLRLLRRHLWVAAPGYGHGLNAPLDCDWVAGLFMAMRRQTFERLGGFDTRYRLYCEDVDLCLRSWNQGLRVQVIPTDPVLHPPRRQTLRRPRHFIWHSRGLLRLWRGEAYRRFESRAP